jgi:hypothetical protein
MEYFGLEKLALPQTFYGFLSPFSVPLALTLRAE